MSHEPTTPESASPGSTRGRERMLSAIPGLWLAACVIWLVIIFVTDVPAWSLAIWIAITLGPITVLGSRLRRSSESAKN